MIGRYIYALLFVVIVAASSCVKAPIDFADNTTTSDPNVTFIDNYAVNLSTYKLDSFRTSGNEVMMLGYHKDSAFGRLLANSYIQVDLPASNPVKNKTVTFDSLVLVVRTTGSYYGDTTLPFKFSAHRLTEKIKNEDASETFYFNPRKFNYNPAPLGQLTVTLRPGKKDKLTMRLPDAFGQELLTKFKNDNADIQDQTSFINYFNGIYLQPDTSLSNAIYYFKGEQTNTVMRLHYKLSGPVPEEKYLDFPLSKSNQFNNISYTNPSPGLEAFTPFKKQLKKTTATGNRAYLHSNIGTYIKIEFPTLLSLKELHTYVKVLKAELVITPTPATYNYPYQLPSALYMYTTDERNELGSILLSSFDPNQQDPLTGNLFIDNLYGERTAYTYNITGYINDLIAKGRFSTDALMLSASGGIGDSQTERLVINDQSLNKGVQLKLYVLGL